MGLEVELKLTLEDEWSYGVVRQWLDECAEAIVERQDNLYLDTLDLRLRRAKVMARLRKTERGAVVTVKTRRALSEGLMKAHEWEVAAQDRHVARWTTAGGGVSWDELDNPARDALADALPLDSTLHVIGAMHTTRRRYEVAPNCLDIAGSTPVLIELDHTLYGDQVERFELELEREDAADFAQALSSQLDALGVAWRPSEESKYEQFLRVSQDSHGI